jgi:hypothetical protein
MQYEWDYITSLAYLTLKEINYSFFPMPPNKIKCRDAMIISYQKYSSKTGLSVEQITCGHELDDAFVLKGLRPGIAFILYNKDKYDNRIKHTLWHEIGHIKCNHQKHGDKEEIEAHFFAAQANAPNVLIKEIAKRGYRIDVPFLVECFGLSQEAAVKKKEYIQKYGFEHSNEYDDMILRLYSEYINIKYPARTKYYHDDYFDKLEEERVKWY